MKLSMMGAKASVDETISSAASWGSAGGGATSLYGWLTSNEMLALIGAAVAVLGFIVNVIFQIRRDRRETELHVARMASLQAELEADLQVEE